MQRGPTAGRTNHQLAQRSSHCIGEGAVPLSQLPLHLLLRCILLLLLLKGLRLLLQVLLLLHAILPMHAALLLTACLGRWLLLCALLLRLLLLSVFAARALPLDSAPAGCITTS
jgi:hypothetical protein